MSMDLQNTFKLIEGIKIPTAPFILTQLHEELQKDEPEIGTIADIISKDISISALVLKAVNSPFFGLRCKINSINQAVSLLGMNYMTNVVAGLALRRSFEDGGGDNLPNYWDSPANVAMVAAQLAAALKCAEPDHMYTLGLFHNAGHAMLVQKFSDYAEFFADYSNVPDVRIIDAENLRYNTDHGVLGYYLARSWGLAQPIANVIREHHGCEELLAEEKEPSIESNMLALLKIAEHIDKQFWGIAPDHEWNRISLLVLEHLGLSVPDFEDLREEMIEKLVSG